MKYAGSCLCGDVSFEMEGEFRNFLLCHCRHCRKDTGSAHAANIFAAGATLTWLSGEDRVNSYQIPDTRHVRNFCSRCGSALPNIQADGALVVVPAGSLDSDVPIEPQGHIFMSSRANWDNQLETIRQFEKYPE
ncbi:GFA family protein [Granulosicoccus sp. 3-233]|uniref:GFA family protein n=1 Tax=Granulosicoccus sp. 3-233 TaxID=3417969 RepID=UPI003D3306E2